MAGKSISGRSDASVAVSYLSGGFAGQKNFLFLDAFVYGKSGMLPFVFYGNHAGAPYDGNFPAYESVKIQKSQKICPGRNLPVTLCPSGGCLCSGALGGG